MNFLLPLFCGFLLLILFILTKADRGLNIKAKTVGDGQYGNARFATPNEIAQTYSRVEYTPTLWRQGKNRPNTPGIIVGSKKDLRGISAWVDPGMVHALMIASPNAGKTAYFLYPNIEYAMACGISFVTLDTKGDLYRNLASVGENCYGYQTIVYDLRRPMQSDYNNLLTLVNRYMDAYKTSHNITDKAKAEKYAKITAKTIIMAGGDAQNYGANAYFYEAAEGLVTAAILILAEYGEKNTRHIVSVIKLLQEAAKRNKGKKGESKPNLFESLIAKMPEGAKAKWYAGAALQTADQSAASVVTTALSRLNAFLDSEMEQMLCFDSVLTMEEFVAKPTAVYIVLPEEDETKYFAVSLMLQQINRELISIADEMGGKLPKKVICFYDELGTVPKMQGLVQMFAAIRSRNVSLVGILQGVAQLKEKYGEPGAETILDCCQIVLTGGFGPLSEAAGKISEMLSTKTVAGGSVSQSAGDQNSRTVNMMSRQLMMPDELRRLPMGSFVVQKTGAYPSIMHMPLFLDWGITFTSEYNIDRRSMREVKYADFAQLERAIVWGDSVVAMQWNQQDIPRWEGEPPIDLRDMEDAT